MTCTKDSKKIKKEISVFLEGGFAPNIPLLREFDYRKAGIILDGLHFSAWILLQHIRARHRVFLEFMKNPDPDTEFWPPAFWGENYQPKSQKEWNEAIDTYEKELKEMISFLNQPETDLFKNHKNGRTLFAVALTTLHHTGYHIGQLKTIGRQLEVW